MGRDGRGGSNVLDLISDILDDIHRAMKYEDYISAGFGLLMLLVVCTVLFPILLPLYVSGRLLALYLKRKS
jgi:hypothetical protein